MDTPPVKATTATALARTSHQLWAPVAASRLRQSLPSRDAGLTPRSGGKCGLAPLAIALGLLCLCCGCVAATPKPGLLNGSFEAPGDLWMSGGGVPEHWQVSNHPLRVGKGGPDGRKELHGNVGLNHRWHALSGRSLYLVDPKGAVVSQALDGPVAAGLTATLRYHLQSYSRAPFTVTASLLMDGRDVASHRSAGKQIPHKPAWSTEELVYRTSADGTLTVRFEFSGQGEIRLDEVTLTLMTDDALAAIARIEQYRVRAAALPAATPAQARKQAVLAHNLQVAADLVATDRLRMARTVLDDVSRAIPKALGKPVYPERGVPFILPIPDPAGNPVFQRWLSQRQAALAKPERRFPLPSADRQTLAGLSSRDGTRATGWQARDFAEAAVQPESPLRDDPEVFMRAYRRLHHYLWNVHCHGESKCLNDFFALNPLTRAAVTLASVYPDLILPHERRIWDRAMRRICDWTVAGLKQRTGRFCNHDLGQALSALNCSIYLGSRTARRQADRLLEAQRANLYPDGAFAYIDSQNECPGYHSAVVDMLKEYWLMSRSPVARELLVASRNYYPLTCVGNKLEGCWTAPMWKFMWNGSGGGAAGTTFAFTRDPWNLSLAGELSDLVNAHFYDPRAKARPLPDNFMVFDRNIVGPRGKVGRWSFATTARRIADRDVGRMTYAGCMVTNPAGSGRAKLNAALMAAYPRVRIKPLSESVAGWQASAHLSHGEVVGITMGRTIGAVTALHQLEGTNYGPSTWPSHWDARQRWINLPDRVVGMIEVLPREGSQLAYDVSIRLRLGYGRAGHLEEKAIRRLDKDSFSYGDLRVIIHDTNLPILRTQPSGILRDAPLKGTEIVLQAPQGGPDAAEPVRFDRETACFAIVEIRPTWVKTNASVVRRMQDALCSLDVTVGNRQVSLCHNVGATAAVWPTEEGRRRRSAAVSRGEQPVGLQALAQPSRLSIPAGQHALVLASPDDADHQPARLVFDDLLLPNGEARPGAASRETEAHQESR